MVKFYGKLLVYLTARIGVDLAACCTPEPDFIPLSLLAIGKLRAHLLAYVSLHPWYHQQIWVEVIEMISHRCYTTTILGRCVLKASPTRRSIQIFPNVGIIYSHPSLIGTVVYIVILNWLHHNYFTFLPLGDIHERLKDTLLGTKFGSLAGSLSSPHLACAYWYIQYLLCRNLPSSMFVLFKLSGNVL